VKFVTASDLPLLYVDRVRKEGIEIETAKAIVANLIGSVGVSFLRDRDRILSVADQFTALAEFLGSTMDEGKYIVIWKREGDGWKLYRDMWSSDSPQRTAQASSPSAGQPATSP